jgi:hypothetical protein
MVVIARHRRIDAAVGVTEEEAEVTLAELLKE